MTNRDIDIDRLIKEALQAQDERAGMIIVSRYRLGSPKKKTLARLGEECSLTRERVRQIEVAALKAIRAKIKEHEETIKFLEFVESYLNDVGHLRRGDFVVRDFAVLTKKRYPDESLYHKLYFLARVLGEPFIHNNDDEWHTFWYNKEEAKETAKVLTQHLLRAKEPDFDKFLKSASLKFNLPDVLIINHLSVSKRFNIGPYGDLGADHWLHVNPQTVRDKAYLVLQKAGEPLHFREIANLVNKLSDKERAAATVHNELIKDPRFILVSRGTYALK